MKLSKKTFDILMNFSKISNGIRIPPGNKIAVMHPLEHIVASATVEETFPVDCALYDLTYLLGAISSFGKDKVELNFEKLQLTVSESENSTSKIAYAYSPPRLIKGVPSDFEDKNPVSPDGSVQILLEQQHITMLSSMIGCLHLSHVRFTFDQENQTVMVKAFDPQGEGSRSFLLEKEVAQTIGNPKPTFSCVIRWDNVVLLKDSYYVTLSNRYVTFANETVRYWVTTEVNTR